MPGISYLVPWFILFSRLKLTRHLLGIDPVPLADHIADDHLADDRLFRGHPPGVGRRGDDRRLQPPPGLLEGVAALVKPGIAAAAILSFIFSWNNFLFSLILANQQTRPLPVAVFSFISYTQIDWGGLNAAATIVTLPVLILILFAQKHMVRGLTLGSVKG
jgi:multiple sugar transport system permease protein